MLTSRYERIVLKMDDQGGFDMDAKSRSSTRKTRTVYRRRLGVFACMLALVGVLFGDIELASASSFDNDQTVIAFEQSGDHSDDVAHGASNCHHDAQCSAQIILPVAPDDVAYGLSGTRRAAEEAAPTLAVSPLHRPPITSEQI